MAKKIHVKIAFLLFISLFCFSYLVADEGNLTFKVEKVIDSVTFQLPQDEKAQLYGLLHPIDWPSSIKEVWKSQALLFQKKHILGKNIVLVNREKDVYGQFTGDIHDEDGLCLQEHLLENGLAIAYIDNDEYHDAESYIESEKKARLARKNIWSQKVTLSAEEAVDQLSRISGSFQIIEGTITSASKHKKTLYLNFGENWKEDMTISVPLSYCKTLAKYSIDCNSLVGKKVRIRGIVSSYFGPIVECLHRWQLEIL